RRRQHRAGRLGRPRRPPQQQRADPRQELDRHERLADEIVGARHGQPAQRLGRQFAGREHHPHPVPPHPPPPRPPPPPLPRPSPWCPGAPPRPPPRPPPPPPPPPRRYWPRPPAVTGARPGGSSSTTSPPPRAEPVARTEPCGNHSVNPVSAADTVRAEGNRI